MKNITFYLSALCLLFCVPAFSQVQVDRQIQLTGSGTDAKINGIQNVSANEDAVSVDYLQRDSLKFAPSTGNSNSYNVNLSPHVTGHYTVGMVVLFQANFANTGPATLNVNSLGADTIMKNYNSYLAANDIKSGQMVAVMFDGSYFQMLSQLGNTSVAAPHGKQRFFSSGNFTVPAGVTTIWVTMSGGGGGGGGGSVYDGNNAGGGGGGAEAVVDSPLTVTSNSTYMVTIGGVGTGGAGSPAAPASSGTAGGNSSFGALVTAYGGGAGGGGGYGYSGNGGGAGGPGGAGGSSSYGSPGGDSIFGANGGGYGAGGSGGSPGDNNGSNGTAGFAIIEW